MADLVIAIKKSQKMDRDILIKIHINQEKNKKNLLGDNHTKLFGKINTVQGYNKKYKEFNKEDIYPCGSFILGTLSIYLYHPEVPLQLESDLYHLNCQSQLALKLLLILYNQTY